MENLEWILSLAGTALSLFVVCITFIVKLVQSIKERSKDKERTELLDAVGPIMEIAETFVNYSGEEKKEYVLTKINQYAIENGIVFDSKLVSEKIEELITLSKQVNKRESD